VAYSPKRGDYHGQVFRSQYDYRNTVAKGRGFASYWEERKYHSGKVRFVGPNFWSGEQDEGAYNTYLKLWLDNLDHKPKPWERAGFDIRYNVAKKSGWSREPNGPLAIFLDYIGIRPLEKYRGIAPGDTPKA
jgi:hypothetical protein